MTRFLQKAGISWGVFLVMAGMFATFVAGFTTLQVTVASNTEDIKEQDRQIEKIDDANDAAAVQRTRIERDVKHILDMLRERRN